MYLSNEILQTIKLPVILFLWFGFWFKLFIPLFLVLFLICILFLKLLGTNIKTSQKLFLYFLIFLFSVVSTTVITDAIYKKHLQEALSVYNPVIQHLDSYKSKNGKYPLQIDLSRISEQKFEESEYKRVNNGHDYIFKVGKYISLRAYMNQKSYYYCSNPKYEQCHPNAKSPYSYKALGKWIEEEYFEF